MGENNNRTDNTFAGVFLIGLAVLFLTGYWWPGIMFVIGAAMIARTVNEGAEWSSNRNALVVLGIGGVFALWDVIDNSILFNGGALWPLLLIAAGLYMLFGKEVRRQVTGGPKRKNDETL